MSPPTSRNCHRKAALSTGLEWKKICFAQIHHYSFLQFCPFFSISYNMLLLYIHISSYIIYYYNL